MDKAEEGLGLEIGEEVLTLDSEGCSAARISLLQKLRDGEEEHLTPQGRSGQSVVVPSPPWFSTHVEGEAYLPVIPGPEIC